MTSFGADNSIQNRSAGRSDVDQVNSRLSSLHELLKNLDEAPRPTPGSETDTVNELVQVRLGIASSLFTALRVRHAPTSDHCLRVALGCSSWANHIDHDDLDRDEIEVAALLHDVGKMGVPDRILRSPNRLTATEAEIMQQTRLFTLHILGACTRSERILRIIEHAPAWFDGSREGFDLRGADLPLGARMLAIVDAFDSMTTDHVYRPAMPHERAIAELFSHAGTQFDPQLVDEFAHLQASNQVSLTDEINRRWLSDLRAKDANEFWQLRNPPVPPPEDADSTEVLFHDKLLESMHDGVIFVDADACVVRWNRGAERLTGLSAGSVMHRRWLPSLVGMRDTEGKEIGEDECPVRYAIKSGTQSMHRGIIRGRRDENLPVDLHAVPIVSKSGRRCGATLLVRDATFQDTLEKRVQSLHERATTDPLTGVANRAEFDHCLKNAVERHLENGSTCSLIICDIDHFKKVNDTYGHQAGDEALVSFAALLQRFSRQEDVVCRYGGEEFVMVCEDCPCASAMELAEKIRRELSRTPLSELKGKCITASFGVTELQHGDTAETILRRADRALLQAKDAGRNRVIQLGTGMMDDASRAMGASGWWSSWVRSSADEDLLGCFLVTYVPMDVTVNKLRGFVADQNADITSITEDRVVLRICSSSVDRTRRQTDRPVDFVVSLQFMTEDAIKAVGGSRTLHSQTIIQASLRPQRWRDRRAQPIEAARTIVSSLRAYLMADAYQTLEDAVSHKSKADSNT
ncbi:MAG: diguanylate cyclase [Planctomycetales bacterium]|nr:diguanylate cyclase [Planctomycetales bacterium]